MEKTEPNSLTESKSLTWTECHRFLIKISFLFFGVSTLLVFFTFLADLDYFDYYQLTNNQNPNIVYPFLIFTLNNNRSVFLHVIKKSLSSSSDSNLLLHRSNNHSNFYAPLRSCIQSKR